MSGACRVNLKSYTVLLLYPDYMASDWPYEYYTAWVRGQTALEAVDKARIEAMKTNPACDDPSDFYAIAVFCGHVEYAMRSV